MEKSISTATEPSETLVDSRSSTMTDPAGLLFSGKVKIFDPNTNEVFVEQRSE